MDNKMILDGFNEVEIENVPIDELESEIVNLVFVGIDGSGSMSRFTSEMKNSLEEFKKALLNSKEADEILLARANFRNYDVEVGGYKKIEDFSVDFYAEGLTPLHDVINEGTKKLMDYMNLLKKNGTRVKAVFAIFSDGEDTSSKSHIPEVIKSIECLNNQEITTAFIGFGPQAENIGKTLKFNNILNINSTSSELRKAFNCLSKSVIESSKNVVAETDDFFVI